jgi:hypothetical protein
MAAPEELRETSRILKKYAKDLRDDAARARERSKKLRQIADRAKLSAHANYAHAKAACHCQDER